MDLKEIRNRIDGIDEEMIALFTRRMEAALEVAKYKKETGMAVRDPAREREILYTAAQRAGQSMERYAKALYTTLLDVSRSYQHSQLAVESPLRRDIQAALDGAPESFPTMATVACQGVEGAYSQQACCSMFELPNILYCKSFDAVFTAVEKGLCRYGVLPIENSTAGSVSQVYDLMEKHRFYIVRGIRQRIDHALLAPEGVRLEDVREILSHPQAIAQCGGFFAAHPSIRVTSVENTAVAAKMVAQAGRGDLAAIASGRCKDVYNLRVLSDSVSDSDNNYTRFLCIGKELEIYPGAGKIGITLSLPHEPGSLYGMLSRFASQGINLTKLESRPVPGKDFEFRFHFDLEASVRSEEVVRLLCDIQAASERFTFLGNYQETY